MPVELDVRDEDGIAERSCQLRRIRGEPPPLPRAAVESAAAVTDPPFEMHLPLHLGVVGQPVPTGLVDLGHRGAEVGQVTRQLRVLGRPSRPEQGRAGAAALGPPEHPAGGGVLQGHP
jgi:hypothetical protein